jgi:hypothetical protein
MRKQKDGGPAYGRLSVIAFDCEKPAVLDRARATIDLVESGYETMVGRGGRRMVAVVRKTSVRFDDH